MTKSNKDGAKPSKKQTSGTSQPQKKTGDFTEDPLSEKIGQSLRSIYDEVASEPVPDAFLALLAKADEKK